MYVFCMYIYMYTGMIIICMCIYVYTCVYVYIYMCIYVLPIQHDRDERMGYGTGS